LNVAWDLEFGKNQFEGIDVSTQGTSRNS